MEIGILIGGVLLGIVTGLTPGVHPNLVGSLLGTLQVEQLPLLIFITGLTHTFMDTIPAVYLFAPEPSTALLLHPSQKYYLEGKAHEAIILTLMGSLFSLVLIAAIAYFVIFFIATIYDYIAQVIPYILLLASIFLLYKEKNKGFALLVFLLAGVLGYVTLETGLEQSLLPLFTGLFGIPSIIVALYNKGNKKQKITTPKIKEGEHKTIINATLFGSFFALLPALGPSQAAAIQSSITKKNSKQSFLITIGCLNTIHLLVSVLTGYQLIKARSGVVATILDVGLITKGMVLNFFLYTLLLALPLTTLCLIFSRVIGKMVNKLPKRNILLGVLGFLLFIVSILTGKIGLLVLATATSVGFLPYLKEVHRTTLMGVLMVPTMIFYFSRF